MSPYLLMAGRAVARARPLPSSLISARAQVFHPHTCLDLKPTARRVLFGILAFVKARAPLREIFPRRDTLRAEALLQSDSTLYRGLAQLEHKGYITRTQSRKLRSGTFYLSPIFLTQKALVLLGLEAVIHNTPSPKMEDGHIKKELTKPQQSLQKTAGCRVSAKNSEIDKDTRLPVELLPLLDQDVKRSAVCWLMGKAKSAGKRLGDIVQVVARNIATLRGREVVAYLTAMIRKEVDFAWVAKQSRSESQSAELDELATAKLETLDARFDGYQVFTEDRSLLGVFRAAAAMGELAHVVSQTGSIPVNLRFARAWMEGKLRLVPAYVREPRDEYEED